MAEGKGTPQHCLVGSLKPITRIRDVEAWLERVCRKLTTSIKMLDLYTVQIQLSSNKMDKMLAFIEDSSSPFAMLERWMEVVGFPPRPQFVKIFGVPLQTWREGIFRLLGDCLG